MQMATAFEWLCEEVEERTALSHLEARGTVRLALKQAGLDPRALSVDHAQVAIDRLLAQQLAGAGVDDADDVCVHILEKLAQTTLADGDSNTPEALFERLE